MDAISRLFYVVPLVSFPAVAYDVEISMYGMDWSLTPVFVLRPETVFDSGHDATQVALVLLSTEDAILVTLPS